MGLFIDSTAPVPRPPVSALAVIALILAATGFVNIVGFVLAPLLAHVALWQLKGTAIRGRRLAIAALWMSYGALAIASVTLVVILVVAYAELPHPHFF